MNYPDKTDNCEGRVYISDRLETENNGEPAPTLTGECELSPPEAYSPLLSRVGEHTSPHLSPLRTGLDSFPSSGSSLQSLRTFTRVYVLVAGEV